MQGFSMKSFLLSSFVMLYSLHAFSYDGLVEKKEFRLDSYKTVAGATIKNVRIGYESYGKLNEDKSNVILVAHYFSGSSHAAGKYATNDELPGYWDSIIGPGRALDTNKYFVISSDTLVNVSPKDPKTITTGPASINEVTGKAYGMDFPLVGVRDFVQIQRKLLDSLGIKKLHAVAGPSAGGAQAIEWAAAYPEDVSRVIAVVPPGVSLPPYVISLLNSWSMPIKLDPKWNQGKYTPGNEPHEGLVESLKLITLSSTHHGWAKVYGNGPADKGQNPLKSYNNKFAVEKALQERGELRAKYADPNSILYMARAMQSFNIEKDMKKIKADVLFIPAEKDFIFPAEISMEAAKILCGLGKRAEVHVLKGDGGHLDGLTKIADATDTIKAFLERPKGAGNPCLH